MTNLLEKHGSDLLDPDIIQRFRGGYLAKSQRSLAVRIAATGDTEGEARDAFNVLLEGWLRARECEDLITEG